MSIREIVKAAIPTPLFRWMQKYRLKKYREKYDGLPSAEVFRKIYEQGEWGKSEDDPESYFSGTGTRNPKIEAIYRESILKLLSSLPKPIRIVDLGCGDFTIGATLAPLCCQYTACDIAPNVIEQNRNKYRNIKNVDFLVLDMTKDDLPDGDIVFVRQVFQHLSNAEIKEAIQRIQSKYRMLILSEHLPKAINFEANIDKPTGPDIRLSMRSGVVLTLPPFNLKCRTERDLCEVPEYGGVIRTTLYEF